MKVIFNQPGSFCENHCWCPAGRICRRGLSTLLAPDERLTGPQWLYDHTGKCQHWVAIDAQWAVKNRYPLEKLEAEFRGMNEKPPLC